MKKLLFSLLAVAAMTSTAQEYFPNNDDISAVSSATRAITNATIITSPGKRMENASILMKDGKIVEIGKNIKIPQGTLVEDAEGTYIYPSFVEAYGDFGMKTPERASRSGQQYDEGREGFYWNDHIRPEQNAIDFYEYDSKAAEKMMEAGYGAVQTHLHDGIARGTGMLVALNNNGNDSERILVNKNGAYYSFDRSRQTNQSYPTSLMGTLALLRQSHFDADWYGKGNSKTKDRSLEALNATKGMVQYIEAGDKKNILRADKLGDRVGKQFVIVGGEDAYEMVEDIKATNAQLILPVNFEDAYDVTNPYQEWYVNLSDMRDWKQGPGNPKMLADAGITYAITTHGLKSPGDLNGKLMKAMEYGLTKEQALASLTTIPAKIIKADAMVGTLEKGKLANFIVTSGELFEKDTKIYENWVQGSKHILKDRSVINADGNYTVQMMGDSYSFDITDDAKKITVKQDSTKLGSKIVRNGDWITVTTSQKDASDKSYTRWMIKLTDDTSKINGKVYMPNGTERSFVATKSAATASEDEDDDKEDEEDTDIANMEMGAITYPNVAFGSATKPTEESILYKNATVWTNEDQGIVENMDVLVKNGKISKIGSNLNAGGARTIDATGMHLTSGIIDEHSHIGIDGGVNEAGHNSTAEVTIEDVVDHEDINLYRDLAGGVTTSQLLHGSANPIGGRSAIIKLKWGYKPDEMIYENSPKFIKFALGENVKQSRYDNGIRFPQTRMGVEQVFEDFFTRAQEYEKTRGTDSFRFDEEMETLSEILKGERYVTCHSYVQTEINMMMEVAERYGFTLNTFTHILEGYKLADKMAAHGAGGSTFSDWWAYKYEVNDAIPYNGAIMHSQGVVTAFNSDDAEMSRRLNQEAAKAVKYGNVSEEEAWKFVTLNPAKLLHIDDRTGSIKEGKDADLVLWNKHPLDIQARPQITMVDGIVFFDIDKDMQMRAAVKKERQQLSNEMIMAKNKGLKTQTPKQSKKTEYHCDTLEW
ncbi:Imidazolonepropionase [Nonlabens sp. Hel1_33_55]|uniref:amidohydrolase family protein n=1 Tax=Nonlabens sp. Hel1_33_55 TaxID=1336802 RepID=UPI000875EE52|nr:amidohydrolase family protein [Nonlabens sp. Hel1_33_55]SCY08284.1 Imidazolonepropionase [Nonlabens sp. Hel1_33_55]